MVGEKLLQAASKYLVYAFCGWLDELAPGEFGVHPSFARGSRHFDHMKIIRTFSYLEKRSDYLFYLSILISIARNENSLRQGFSLSEAKVLMDKLFS